MDQISSFIKDQPNHFVERQFRWSTGLLVATIMVFGIGATILINGPDTVEAASAPKIEERVVSQDFDSRLRKIEDALVRIANSSERTSAALGDVKVRLKSVLDATGELRPVPGANSFEGWMGFTQNSPEASKALRNSSGANIWVYMRSVR